MISRERLGRLTRKTDSPGPPPSASNRRFVSTARLGCGSRCCRPPLSEDQRSTALAAGGAYFGPVSLLLVFVLAVAMSLAVTPRALAAHDWAPIEHHWTFDNPGCTGEPVDPITLIMFGDGISAVDVRDMVQWHTGWGSSTGGTGGQWVITYAVGCDEMDENNASANFHSDRYHARWNYGGGPKYYSFAATQSVSPWGTGVVVGTPHYEVGDETCGETLWLDHHRAIDYAGARNRVLYDMSSHHPYEWVWYGNTEPSPQCGNTSVAQSDGWAAYVFTWPPDDPPGWDPPMEDTTH